MWTSRALFKAALLLTAIALPIAGGVLWWQYERPFDPEHPDTVSPADLRAALAPDASLPLDAQHTDVLMIAACTLRQDRLEAYGHDAPTSPFLDMLGASGVVFEHNFSQAPWTRPAMGALLTGRWPRVLGLDTAERVDNFDMVVQKHHTLLGEALKDAGYTTIASVANPNLKGVFGFAQGFDQYREPAGTYKDRPHIPMSDEIVDDILEMAASVPLDQRLYARLVVLDGHKTRHYAPHYRRLFGGTIDDPEIDQDVGDYDAALRTIDAQLARLVVTLRETRPNLLVVFAADHGEGLRLPESHGPEHGNFVYRSTTETPLIYQHPALPKPGRRVGGLGMNVDVKPTVLDLLGLEPTAPVDGVSQAAAVLGEVDRAAHAYAFTETFFRKVHRSMVFDGEHQLIRKYVNDNKDARHLDQLFAASDRAAEQPLERTESRKADALAAVLDTWEAQMDQWERDAPARERGTVDASTRTMLQDLGYLDASDDE